MNNEKISSKKTSKLPSSPLLLRQERERRGWSQSELAERIGTNQVSISRWEKGIVTPTPYFRQKLGELFGKSLEELGLFTSIENENNEDASISSISPTSPLHASQWNVPYRRNPFFTGRDDILTSLYTMLNDNKPAALTQTQAISGLGGIGKTQIAIEYAYRYRDNYQAVLWINASRDTLIVDFGMLATLLELPERHEQDQSIVVRAVKRWLDVHKNWLLILDNVDDLEMLIDFLPTQGGTGSFLLTTRLQALGPIAQSIEVEKMGLEDGVMFLLRRTKMLIADAPFTQSKQEHWTQAVEIVTLLDGLPLALDQAGAYIEETKCGFSAYVSLYSTHRKELLLRRGRLPVNHPEPIATTWYLSFQQIEQENPLAADLLRLLAFLGPDVIPEEIITGGFSEFGTGLDTIASDFLAVNAIIELLLRYSLLRRTPEVKFLSIHRLVQAVLKDGMEKDQQLLWAERAIRAINKAFPDVELKTWAQCQRCLPHAQIAAEYMNEYELAFPEAARLLNQAANYLRTHAQYAQAETLLQQALNIREQVLEPTHPDIAASLNSLALLYYAEGKYMLAEDFYLQALHIRQQILEPEHPDIAQSLSNLAELYTAQGKYIPAEQYYLQALVSQEKALGLRRREVAKTLNNLALLYRSKGEYTRAEQFYLQALNIQKLVFGTVHPDVAQTLHNIARLHRAQGEYAKAEPLYQQALAIREDVFGPNHPLVAQSLYGIAKLYNSQGKYSQAEELGQQALSIQEQCLGIYHPDIADTLAILAKIYQIQENYSEAEELYRRALILRESAIGSEHPRVALLISTIAEVYQAQGKYQEAESLIRRSLAIRERSLGRQHPYIAYDLSNLAENYYLQTDYLQAKQYFNEALVIREQILGLAHPHTASTYHNLAKVSFALHQYEEAVLLYQKALEIREQSLGLEHPDVATTLEHFAKLLYIMEREDLACTFEARAQAIRAKSR